MDLNGLSDYELIERVAAKDEAAFEALYDRHRSQAFGLALRVTGARPAAEEVAQDAFLSVWRSADRYHPERGSVSSWLLSIVRNRGIDALRRNQHAARNVELGAVLAAPLRSRECTDELALAREEAREARSLLDHLPSGQRQVVELAYFAGMTQTEIAARIGVPLGTVKGRSRLALEKLRDAVAGEATLASAR